MNLLFDREEVFDSVEEVVEKYLRRNLNIDGVIIVDERGAKSNFK